MTDAYRELVAWTPAPRPGSAFWQSHQSRFGSATKKSAIGSAVAVISGQTAWATWASFLLYPSFYLRVGSAFANTMAPRKAAKTMDEVLIII